jgi:hypothetical protein
MLLIGNLKLGASLEPGFCSFDQGICAREAKKIGLAYRTWALDNNDNFQWKSVTRDFSHVLFR